MKQRILAIVFCIGLLATFFSGCKPNQSNSEEASSGMTSVSEESSDAESTAPDDSGTESAPSDKSGASDDRSQSNGPKATTPGKGVTLDRKAYKINSQSYPIVTEGTATIRVMLPSGSYDTQASGFAKAYERKTGVSVKYSPYNQGDIFTLKNVVIKSGNTPDIFLSPAVGIKNFEIEQYAKDKLIVDLAPYLDTWGPNIKKETAGFIFFNSNKIYGLPRVPSATGAEMSIRCESQMYINKVWLDELGLSIPKTTEELRKVLEAFVTQDPDGNSKNDTYGLGLTSWRPQMWNPWGLNMSWYYLGTVDEKGKSDWGPLTDQFREGILFYKNLWDNGLMSKEVINAATTALRNTHLQKCGVIMGVTPGEVVNERNLKDWIPIATPQGGNTGNYKAGISESFGSARTVKGGIGFPNIGIVFSSCKDVELVVRWLDFFYTQEGTMLVHYGPEGKAYTKTSKGYKLFRNATTLREGQWAGTTWFPGLVNVPLVERSESEMTLKEQAGAFYEKIYRSVNRHPKYSYRVLTEFVTYEESTKLSSWNLPDTQWGYQAIIGDVNIHTEWNSYVSKHATNRNNFRKLYDTVFGRVYK